MQNNEMQNSEYDTNEELRDSLIAISVVSKRLARVLEEKMEMKGDKKCQDSMD